MKSIASKLWLGMTALVAIILILLWLFQIVFLDSFYTELRINEIKKAGEKISREIADLGLFENRLDELAYNNNMTAELIDMDRNTIYTTGITGMNGMMPMMRNAAARTEAYNKAVKGEIARILMTHPRFNSEFILLGLPVGTRNNLQGALLLSVPLAPVEDTVNILKKQLIYITIILLAATLIISFLLSKSFTRPILDIIGVSMAIAKGDMSARIKLKRKDEIGRLAETINYMGNEISKTDLLRKDLIANVSHELRTPLSLIKGYAETIRDVSGSNEEKRDKQLGIIIDESDRLSRIVEDILNLSQMQAGYYSLKLERIRLDDIIVRLVKRYEILSESTGVDIVIDKTVEAFVEGDISKLEQVMYNLINNAFNHSPEGSVVHISMSEKEDKIRVEVSDSGEGIPQNELQNIWERFYKVDKQAKKKRAGTGLGLAIVKSILDAHKAMYGADSQPGSGAAFWFELNKV